MAEQAIPSAPGTRSAGLEPEVLCERRTQHTLEQDLRVPSDLACWPGHFPARPIVPGVLQVDWVMKRAAAWSGHARLVRIEGLKFKVPMLPGQRFRLTLEFDADAACVHFRVADGATLFSLGRLRLDPGREGRP